jgi:protein SCO1/2
MKKLLPVLALAAMLMACDKAAESPPSFKNTDVTGLQYAQDFSLTDHNGVRRTLADFRGKLVLVFFGYTQCPDVCPTTMAQLAAAVKQLGPQADKVQVLMITVDPERDTAELLKQYAPGFHPTFLGLRGSLEETEKTIKDFKSYFAKVEGKTKGSYTMDHMANVYVFDQAGKVRLYVRPENFGEPLVHDLKQLLK